MFFHGMFHSCHDLTGILGIGMQLASAIVVERELEESRERRARSVSNDKVCDKCGRPSRCYAEDENRG